jgi:hypothetical protein
VATVVVGTNPLKGTDKQEGIKQTNNKQLLVQYIAIATASPLFCTSFVLD